MGFLGILYIFISIFFSIPSKILANESETPPKIQLDVRDPIVIEASQFFLQELSLSSDSGIYKTLKLGDIGSAFYQEGVFHENLYLEISLSSPYFRSRQPVEIFDVIVMKHFSDGSRSFAIDRFPDMDDDAVERFWIQKVERHRQKREELFEQLLQESKKDQLHATVEIREEKITLGVEGEMTHTKRDVNGEMESLRQLMTGLTVEELIRVLEHAAGDPIAAQVAADLLDLKYKSVSSQLDLDLMATKTIPELYTILLDPDETSEKKKFVEMLINYRLQILKEVT